MISILHATILGAVEGITEFLPISSTGHMVITSHFLGLTSTDFLKSFIVVIQLGSILAVVSVYGWKVLTQRSLWPRLIAAFIPTAVVGFVLYKLIRDALGSTSVVLAALFIGGIIMIAFEKWYQEPADAGEDLSKLPLKHAFLIGLAQSLAVIPGVSRAAATIVSGLALGLSRRAIVEFSFLLAIPTMIAATGYDLLKDHSALSGPSLLPLIVGLVTSYIVALITIHWLLDFIRKHDFTAFGVYRIVLASVLWFVIR